MTVTRAASDAGQLTHCHYTIGTLTNDRAQYNDMLTSFKAKGFDDDTCEFLFIDTAQKNAATAYDGLNSLLNEASGDIVILCHQDVRLIEDDRKVLDTRLDALSQKHPDWALAGNAGGMAPGQLAIRITDPHGADQRTTPLPARVVSLDENFLIIRRSKRLSFSANLKGFHFYGADICLIADIMGYSSYVIDFHLEHLSPGKKDESYRAAKLAFHEKWSEALRPRWIQTTCSLLHVAGERRSQTLAPLWERLYRRIAIIKSAASNGRIARLRRAVGAAGLRLGPLGRLKTRPVPSRDRL